MKHYVDVVLAVKAGALAPAVAVHIVRAVHHYLANHDARVAIGLPDMKAGENRRIGDRVRLYGDNQDDLEVLADLIEDNKAVRDHVVVKRIKRCPEHPGKWVAYARYRFPRKGKSIRRSEEATNLSQIPVIFARSQKDPDQRFGLGVQRLERSEQPDTDDLPGRLNGYGLSTRAEPFWLPHIP